MAAGTRGGRRPFPYTPAGEERGGGAAPPAPTLRAGGSKSSLVSIHAQGTIKEKEVSVNVRRQKRRQHKGGPSKLPKIGRKIT